MKDGKFEKGDYVIATCNFIPECRCEVICEMPAIEKGDTNTYYKVKPLLKGYRNTRHITELVRAV